MEGPDSSSFGIRLVQRTPNAPFPGLGVANAVTVPADVRERLVYASFVLNAGITALTVAAFVETVAGSGAYNNVKEVGPPSGTHRHGIDMPVKGGLRYYFDVGIGAAANITNEHYSFDDLR